MARHSRSLAILAVCHLCACASNTPQTPEDAAVAIPDLAPDVSYPSDGGETSCGRAIALACGESKAGNNTGGANWIDLYGCATAPNSGPEAYYDLRTDEAMVVTIDLTPTDPTQDLDLFVLDATCSADSCFDRSLNTGNRGEQVRFLSQADTDYRIVVDGYLGGGGVGTSAFQIAATCATTQCTPTATTIDCSTTALAGHNGQAGSTDRHDRYGCGSDAIAREYIYRFASNLDGEVTLSLDITDASRNLDLFILEDRGAGCDVGACLSAATTQLDEVATFHAAAGTTYYVVVDGASDNDLGPYTLTVTCPTPDGGASDAPSD